MQLRYADNLTMVEHERFTQVSLRNPWDTTRVLHRYVLVSSDSDIPAEELPEGTVVKVPLKHSVVYTALHCSLMDELGVLDAIAGVCDLKYIQIPEIAQACKEGRIHDLGSGMGPDVERMIELDPDAILLSPFENSGGYGKVDQLGVAIIECADYMETSPLGRAEWMRFYGRLFGRSEEADSLFNRVEESYLHWKSKTATATGKPSAFCDLPIGNATWYMPGGRSTIGQLYADAGADYLFKHDDRTGSIPLSFETVFDKAENADVWLIRDASVPMHTYASLKADYAPYTRFKAFKERNVYQCNTLEVPFFEEVPFHPDRLLRDFILIFHPELSDGKPLRYYRALEE